LVVSPGCHHVGKYLKEPAHLGALSVIAQPHMHTTHHVM
jgi:hypothetical protein